jgi:hypothetical protein
MRVHVRSGANRFGLHGHREVFVRPPNSQGDVHITYLDHPSITPTTEGSIITKSLSIRGVVPVTG